ncbi:MBL fold metallo-hydrolase [Mycobacterium sp. 236(2023)]|uniref:MBL fold metallo-hydrolase n=1 Tax=Mycobacterium sp. 236(2023) TaxID=3038163 RepID=UPI002415265A|nr:MBL fold metallo-hydrolase [Mycobacterium sp. 236(2023)]MDG4665274.1 MBL fold metallo-hydrolase [Mycobacterium sp. 236(2023)]
MRLTHIGGPTVLVELAGWRILTDPTFDPPGRRYGFGWGTSSVKTAGPALAADGVGDIDVVLLSHDHHADNLDDAGRALLARAGEVITTAPGAGRLGGGATGLENWESTTLTRDGLPALTVTATPCRHGPPLSRPIAGKVIGFAVSVEGDERTDFWMTGDTVVYPEVLAAAERLDVDVALVHLGGVRFPLTGPVQFTMTAAGAVDVISALRPRVAVPVHCEGWSHFREQEADARRVFDASAVRDTVRWVTRGVSTQV